MKLKREFVLRTAISIAIISFNKEVLGWSGPECVAGLSILIIVNGFWTLFSAMDGGSAQMSQENKRIAIVSTCGQGRTLGTPKAKLIICDEMTPLTKEQHEELAQTVELFVVVAKRAANILKWASALSKSELKQIMIFESLYHRRIKRTKRIKPDQSRARNRQIEKAKGGGGHAKY